MGEIVLVPSKRPGARFDQFEWVPAADGGRKLMSFSNRYSVETANWEVMWVTVKKGEKRIVSTQFGSDFVAAQELYVKVLKAKKPLATLACVNIGFPPPEKYMGKMAALNRQGLWWCPFCMKLRRFEKTHWREIDGDMYTVDDAVYRCPMCETGHSSWDVRRWNPIASRLYEGKRARGNTSGKRKKRRR